MQVNELVEKMLMPLGYPITENQFIPYADKPVPSPPYIVYVISSESTDGSDLNPADLLNIDINIEFYSDRRDRISEKQIERALSKNHFDFEKSYVYIDSEELHKTTYYISLINKEM